MNIKVCGITSLKQLEQLDGLNVDFAGLVFYKQSPRYAEGKISGKDIKSADLDIKTVGEFMNASFEEIMKTVKAYNLDVVQLHGDESPHLCEQVSNEIEVIKTFAIDDSSEKSIDYMVKDYDEVCDYYLFYKASGKDKEANAGKFDWNKISSAQIEKPIFLSGGIGPTDATLVKKFKHPDFYGVNLNSRFEKEPGQKDMALLLQFMHALK
jgi:phosphoribosylanthranilate isomerase